MRNVKRARQALAQDQAAWNSSTQKKVHYLINGEYSACSALWTGYKEITTFLSDVTCNKCLKTVETKGESFIASKVHYLIDDETLACGLAWEMENVGCSTIADVTCGACIAAYADMQHTEKEESSMSLTTFFTLAPGALDKDGTQEVRSGWLFQGVNGPEPIRQVLVPSTQAGAQMNAYLAPIPYIAFNEETLEKYIKQGKVTKASTNGIAFDPIKAAIELSTTTTQEDTTMPRTKSEKLPARTAKVEALRTKTPQGPAIKDTAPLGILPDAKIRTLDAILATPIALAPVVPHDSPEGRQHAAIAELKTRMDTPKKPIALPQERSEQALVAALAPAYVPAYSLSSDPLYVQLVASVEALAQEMRVMARRLEAQGAQAPVPALTMHDILSNVWEDIIGSVDIPEKAPVVPDAWGDMLGEVQAPAKPKSTLKVFAGGNTAPKVERQGGSKTDPAIIKAIQKAWRDKTHTQVQLAAKYGMDEKKVWYFCSSRCKQYV